MESTLQIMPVQRTSRNFGEYAEEAVIIEEPIIKQKRPLFIEANTIEASLEHLRNDCIIPVFAKDNEAALSHVAFIEAVQDATNTFFSGEQIESPDIRVSHVIKGRIPEAIHKPANQLLESDKTIYYERCAFVIEVPTIYETVHGNRLTLTIGVSELITTPIFIQRRVRSGLKCLLASPVRFAQIYVYLQTVILVAWKLPIQGIYIKRYWKCSTNTMQPSTYI